MDENESIAQRDRYERILDAAELHRRCPHQLRHTFASRLCRAGVGLVHAQNLLGHSDPRLTAAIYTHLDVEDLRRAVQILPSSTDVRGS